MLFVSSFCQGRKKKKNGECSFLFPFYHETERKNAFPFAFSRRRKKALRFPSPLLENSQKERRMSPFLLHSFPTANGMTDLPSPWKKKKTRRWKNADRRKKDKSKEERKEGKRSKARERRPEKRQRNALQKGTFLAQESRERTGRGFPSGSRKRGWECHFSPHDRDDGRTAHPPAFPLPIRISKHGKSGEPYFALFPLSPSWHERLLPSPSLSFPLLLSVYLGFHLWFTKICEKPTPLGVGWIAQSKKHI